MSIQYHNCLIAQSGGPTTAINASLAGILSAARRSGRIKRIYGALNGIQGVLSERFLDLDTLFSADSDSLLALKHSPAMYLGSCRYKLSDPDTPSEDYKTIFDVLNRLQIGFFFYIGGNDSMDTIKKLSHYGEFHHSSIRFIGVPKTIDNDLPATDHAPGYGSAARYIAVSVLEMAYDTYIYNTPSVLILEIMGRDAGWLTAASALARTKDSPAPHLIYLPERSFSDEAFLSDVKRLLSQQRHVVVAVSEGIRYADGSYVSADTTAKDQFGHATLNGAGKCLEHLVASKIGCKVRSVELNILQRCAAHLASATDLDESFCLGEAAFNGAIEGRSGQIPILKRLSNTPYQIQITYAPLGEIANQEKNVPADWINEAGNDVTNDFIQYARPLIQGTPQPVPSWENGLPVFPSVHHLLGI